MTASNSRPTIVVCGSINLDLVVRADRLPMPGETRLAHSLHEVSGGKGANQAVAIARLGMHVAMVGRVGQDGFADTLVTNLRAEGIDTQWIERTAGPSGVAIVTVDDQGQNAILVVPGANGQLTPQDVDRCQAAFSTCDWVVLQLEIPLESVKHAIELAKRLGKRVLLNPAPAPRPSQLDEFESVVANVDLLCPNQSEAESLLGRPIHGLDDARLAAFDLRKKGPKSVVLTLGQDGCVVADAEGVHHLLAVNVTARDTTAAGDAFIGALVVRKALGDSLVDACRFASAAAAYSVTVPGAQPSLPRLEQVHEMLNLARNGS